MMNKINQNIDHDLEQERFYEKPFNEVIKKPNNQYFPSEELDKI